MAKVLLASTSAIKKESIQGNLHFFFGEKKIDLTCYDCDELKLPPQPVNISTLYCAYERLKYAKAKTAGMKFDMYIAVENGIFFEKNPSDKCYMVMEYQDVVCFAHSAQKPTQNIFVKPEFIDKLKKTTAIKQGHIFGYNKTVGELINEKDKNIDPKNWMLQLNGVDRKTQIGWALNNLYLRLSDIEIIRTKINSQLVIYPDFPKKGVAFKDLFSILSDPVILSKIGYLMGERFMCEKIDYILGLESRGLILGALMAKELGVKFLPARKPGKLPGKVVSMGYEKEYDVDSLEMQTNIPPNSNILIVDDLVATGGSLRASELLVEKVKCNVVACCVLFKVEALWDRAKKTVKSPIVVILH